VYLAVAKRFYVGERNLFGIDTEFAGLQSRKELDFNRCFHIQFSVVG